MNPKSVQTRSIVVTPGALRNHNLTITGLQDFFPIDAVGGPNRNSVPGKPIQAWLEGLDRLATLGGRTIVARGLRPPVAIPA